MYLYVLEMFQSFSNNWNWKLLKLKNAKLLNCEVAIMERSPFVLVFLLPEFFNIFSFWTIFILRKGVLGLF